jgi:hypothetical protein
MADRQDRGGDAGDKGGGGMKPQAAALIAEAEKWVGYLEKETGACLNDFKANAGDGNFTVFGAWYGLNGYAWCAMFVSYAAWKAGIPETVIPKQKSCTADGVAFFRRAGRWHPEAGYLPQPGDIVYFTRDGGKTAAHTGIVCKTGAARVYTIEGNTSGGSALISNGGSVVKKSYPLAYDKIFGYGNPAYTDETADRKAIIQSRCGFSDPEGFFSYIDKFDYAEAAYQKWAESYE